MLSRIPPRMVIYACLAIAISTLFLRNVVYVDARISTETLSAGTKEAVIISERGAALHHSQDYMSVSGHEK